MEKGQISVQTENIFPIIKKFLYSDHEIFLRELISNAVDATQKLKTFSSRGEVKGELGNLSIEVKLDEKKKTLTVSDHGIGLTADEVKKYINQIAFSSASEFLEKYKDEKNIIGHFGLGFYSSFMVADKVEIKTKSFQDAPGVTWECDGSPEFSIKENKKTVRGTDIVLHINEESKEFLSEWRIRELLDKYCKFLPVEIIFGSEEITETDKKGKEKKVTKPKIINNTSPAWTKAPIDLKDEDYQAFYKELYPYSEPPLFWIHLNVDYPFNLTGILYFPKLGSAFEVQKNKIQLYSNQVFVTDSVQEIVPEWLALLHGVIDSPDIPLNVSRSYLQSDPNVKKINSHISKKVADKLEEIFKEDRTSFEEKWEHIGVFVKYGMLSDEKFYDRGMNFCLFESVSDGKYTQEEYREKVKSNQTDKNGSLVYIYTNNAEGQHTYIEAAQKMNYDIIKMDTVLDNHFVNHMEMKLEKTVFKRVDAESVELLVEKEEERASLLTEKEETDLKNLVSETIADDKIQVEVKPLGVESQSLLLTMPEFTRRMKDMSKLGGNEFMANMPDQYNITVNANSPVIQKILNKKGTDSKKKHIRQLYDLALLSQGMLKGKALSEFIQRSQEMMQK